MLARKVWRLASVSPCLRLESGSRGILSKWIFGKKDVRVPMAPRVPTTLLQHGVTWNDEYRWMQDRPDLLARHLDKEETYFRAMMADTKTLQRDIAARVEAVPQGDVGSSPEGVQGYLYYSREPPDPESGVFRRRPGYPEEALLTGTEIGEGHGPGGLLGELKMSKTGRKLAYTADIGPGEGQGEACLAAFIKHLDTGVVEALAVGHQVGSMEWMAQDRALIYTVLNPRGLPDRAMLHVLGNARADDRCLMEETREGCFATVTGTKDGALILLNCNSKTSAEVYIIRSDDINATLRLIEPRRPSLEYFAEHHMGHMFFLTNMGDPKNNYRLATAPLEDPGFRNWRVLVPEHPNIILEDLVMFRSGCVLIGRHNSRPAVFFIPLPLVDNTPSIRGPVPHIGLHTLQFPPSVTHLSPGVNLDFHAKNFRVYVSSPVLPDVGLDISVNPECWGNSRTDVRGDAERLGRSKSNVGVDAERSGKSNSALGVDAKGWGKSEAKIDSGFKPETWSPPSSDEGSTSVTLSDVARVVPVISGSSSSDTRIGQGGGLDHDVPAPGGRESPRAGFPEGLLRLAPRTLEEGLAWLLHEQSGDSGPVFNGSKGGEPSREVEKGKRSREGGEEGRVTRLLDHVEGLRKARSIAEREGSSQPGRVGKQLGGFEGVSLGGMTCGVHMVGSRGGMRVPLTIAHQVGIAMDGSHPVCLTVYGAYGATHDADYDPANVVLMQDGWVRTYAHVRGGGELGRRWHEQGRGESRENALADLEACVDYLITKGYTRAGRIALKASSAGGLLAGSFLNKRARVLGACVLDAPFVDVLSTMMDPDLMLTAHEYEEWGDPRDPAAGSRFKTLCPYLNMDPDQKYPPILVTYGRGDDVVPEWGPAKWVARVRAAGGVSWVGASGSPGGGSGVGAIGCPVLMGRRLGSGHYAHPGDASRQAALVHVFLTKALFGAWAGEK